MRAFLNVASAITLVAFCQGIEGAEYRVHLLKSAPLWGSGWGVYGNSTAGTTSIETAGFKAVLWPNADEAPVSLHPAGFVSSYISDIYGEIEVGRGTKSGDVAESRALLWRSTAESVVDLHPPGYHSTSAHAVTATLQAGAGRRGVRDPYHALIWHGAAETIIDLHDPTYTHTYINDAVGDGQVGYGTFDPPNLPSIYHALLWYGTADSLVDLHPIGYRITIANGGGESVQVGYGITEDDTPAPHALLWRGSADSVVDLHPAGYSASNAAAAAGIFQVGNGGRIGGDSGALAWRGTADSVINLHEILEIQTGIDFRNSLTTDVDEFGNVVGWGDTYEGMRYAIRWSLVPEPGCWRLMLLAGLCGVLLRNRNLWKHQVY